MTDQKHHQGPGRSISKMRARAFTMAAWSAIMLTPALIASPGLQAQTYQVIHSFNSATDGALPNGLTRDAAGNLYGTTLGGGRGFEGTVFRINSSGTERILYEFNLTDGAAPRGITRDPAGNLYGTTLEDTANPGHGTVYKQAPDGTHT